MTVSPEKRLLVIGKNGQLACSIAKIATEFPDLDIKISERSDLDLSDLESIENYFSHNHYDIIVNAAAYTAVDRAESEPELADLINHQAVKKISEIALQQDSVLIHISTDYVFDGKSNTPYKEEDPVSPTSMYGKTKLLGERAMLQISPKGCIVRTSWLYSEFGNNFVKNMIRLGRERDELSVVYDQVGSPTYATDLARAALRIAQSNMLAVSTVPEIYHFSNDGVCSWFDFAKNVFELAKIDCKVVPITSEKYPATVDRPHYSVLQNKKLVQNSDVENLYWRDSLKSCLKLLETEGAKDAKNI